MYKTPSPRPELRKIGFRERIGNSVVVNAVKKIYGNLKLRDHGCDIRRQHLVPQLLRVRRLLPTPDVDLFVERVLWILPDRYKHAGHDRLHVMRRADAQGVHGFVTQRHVSAGQRRRGRGRCSFQLPTNCVLPVSLASFNMCSYARASDWSWFAIWATPIYAWYRSGARAAAWYADQLPHEWPMR